MESTTLDEFVALNDQLSALVEAGVPLDIGLGPQSVDTPKTLARINAAVTSRVGRGESLAEALQGDEETMPAAYRSMMQIGLHGGSLSAALDGSNQIATSVNDSRFAIRSALLYPLIVCGLAFLGLIGFSQFLTPTLEETYESLRIQPGFGLRVMEAIRDTRTYWIAIPPALLLLTLGWRWLARNHRATTPARPTGVLSRLVGSSRTLFEQRCASFSETLAALLAGGTSLEEGLRLAAGVCSDAGLVEGARALAASLKRGKLPSDDSPDALRFPPFLRWSLWHSEETIGRDRALQMAATIYRESASRRAERLRIIAPIVACVFIGGGAVLLYGLTLFVPVVELIHGLVK